MQRLSLRRHMCSSGENGVTQVPSLFSQISNRAPVLCLQLFSTPCFFTLHDQPQAVPLSRVLSQMRLFSPASYFQRTEALTRSAPLQEGLTEQWPNAGCTQEYLQDPAVPGAQDCGQVPAHPRKCSQDSVAVAFQGLWKITTHIWHQASPLTILFQHQRMWFFSRVHWGLAFGGQIGRAHV